RRWRKKRPELFTEGVYNQAGLDAQRFSPPRWQVIESENKRCSFTCRATFPTSTTTWSRERLRKRN
ncbi:MAG: hypothetical protein JXX14_24330, partial [Deltaproteobacteria bacterium]|nr:hypothetical protein [Deltaproteobacteria bacterium]